MKLTSIITNARLPLSDRPDRVCDIAVIGETIVGAGATGDFDSFDVETTFDADGQYAYPGFNDVHAHSVWFGQTLLEINLSAARTCADVYATLAEHKDDEDSEWIIASNFSPAQLADGPVNIEQLDALAGGRPLLIKHISGHALTVNTRALDLAGITRRPTLHIPGGEIRTDSDGLATGVLDENAMRPVQKLLQPESLDYIERALGEASKVYASEGITSVTDAGIAGGWIGHSPLELSAYQNALAHGKLLHRSQVMITFDALHAVNHHPDDPAPYTLDAGLRTGLGDSMLQIGPTKIFTDGSILGTTAAMSENYYCHGHSGFYLSDPEEMKENALRAASNGWSLALHALGDAGVELAIDTIEAATKNYGRPAIPHRIEHGGVTTDEQILRIARLNIAVAPQPRFIAEFGDQMAQVLGEERTAISYPAKRLLTAGAILPGSSDRPVADGHPLRAIQSFVERKTESGADYSPNDRISVHEAVNAYTFGSASATGWERSKGQIAEGYLGDIVILDRDILSVPTEEISHAQVLATLRGGTPIFHS